MESEQEFAYRTISRTSESSFRDRNSRFLGFAFPVNSEDEVSTCLQQLKKQYHDARHYCYAYVLGRDKSKWRANDDGEPSGSAGLPIYNQILSSGLTNILVVVVRYFGGTKLGVPGLINAYKTATRLAIENADVMTVVPTRKLEVLFSYESMNTVMSYCKHLALAIESKDFSEQCRIIVQVPVNLEQNVIEFLKKAKTEFNWIS